RVFGDIVDTFDSESRRLSDAILRGEADGYEIGVCDAGVGRRCQCSRAVPPLRREPDDRLQVAGALGNGGDDGASGALASSAEFASTQRGRNGGGGALGASRASGLGWAQDRQAVEGSGRASRSSALYGDGDSEAAWDRTGRTWRWPVGLHPLRAGTAERVVADGLQRPCGPARRPASSADRA